MPLFTGYFRLAVKAGVVGAVLVAVPAAYHIVWHRGYNAAVQETQAQQVETGQEMLDEATRRPRSRSDIADRMRSGAF